MPSFETLLVFTAAAMVLNLSPGPSNFYVLARSVGQGLGPGILAALGLSLLFEAAPVRYTALKFIGAAYLIYLGARTFFCEGRAWIFSRNRWEIKTERPARKRVGRGFEPKDGVVFHRAPSPVR